MFIVHVHITVKTKDIDAFKQATLENTKSSLQEPGITLFELIQSDDDQNVFILLEAYRTVDDQVKHKQTAHFKKWVETVDAMMDKPRYAEKFIKVFSNDLELIGVK